MCGQDMITIFAPDKPYKVYCSPCWWSDKWDGLEYSQDYNPSRNFFEQLRELQFRTPFMNLINGYTTLVNSEYINHAGYAKNCYLIFNSDQCENVMYGSAVNFDKDTMDALFLDESELCYEVINGHKCYRVFFSEDCSNCHNVYFSKNLSGCNNCFGSINLRNKSYYIFNKPYSKESYEKEIRNIRLDLFSSLKELKNKIYDFWLKHPQRYYHGVHNVNSSGDYVYECKNANYMYQAKYVEDGKFGQLLTMKTSKDVYDYTEWGDSAQRIYDCITVGQQADSIKFCFGSWSGVINNEYSMFAVSCSNVFGCVNLRNKQYCILNKQYTKEEHEQLREKIIQDMNDKRYTDSKGRVWKYGEFFPYDLSLFDYNESAAIQYFPLQKKDALNNGWRWREPSPSEHKITLQADQIPDSINEIQDNILTEVLGCKGCGKAFKLIKPELELLRKFGFPLPRLCPDCRHMARMKKLNPPRLWSRQCAKCGKDIKTSYSPERPEIVYCEACYQNEVI